MMEAGTIARKRPVAASLIRILIGVGVDRRARRIEPACAKGLDDQ